jgi:hypothetical protein
MKKDNTIPFYVWAICILFVSISVIIEVYDYNKCHNNWDNKFFPVSWSFLNGCQIETPIGLVNTKYLKNIFPEVEKGN